MLRIRDNCGDEVDRRGTISDMGGLIKAGDKGLSDFRLSDSIVRVAYADRIRQVLRAAGDKLMRKDTSIIRVNTPEDKQEDVPLVTDDLTLARHLDAWHKNEGAAYGYSGKPLCGKLALSLLEMQAIERAVINEIHAERGE